MTKNSYMYKIGDIVRTVEGLPKEIGIVRHIGMLKGLGTEDSIWSDWGKDYKGVLLPVAEGGVLTALQFHDLVLVGSGDKVIIEKVVKKNKNPKVLTDEDLK